MPVVAAPQRSKYHDSDSPEKASQENGEPICIYIGGICMLALTTYVTRVCHKANNPDSDPVPRRACMTTLIWKFEK
jgi:hypothetical protein